MLPALAAIREDADGQLAHEQEKQRTLRYVHGAEGCDCEIMGPYK
jgi:hypothetical protein